MSTKRKATVALPPHVARVYRAAMRESLGDIYREMGGHGIHSAGALMRKLAMFSGPQRSARLRACAAARKAEKAGKSGRARWKR